MKRLALALLLALLPAAAAAQSFIGDKTPIFGQNSGTGAIGYRIGPNTFQPIGTADPVTQAWRPLLQPPTTSILGGVLAKAAIANQFIVSINADGSATSLQPTFGMIAGVATTAQLPVGTSGSTLCLLNANCTWSGTETFAGIIAAQNAPAGFSGLIQGNTPDGVRRWYIGYGDGGTNSIFTGDNGWGIKIVSAILTGTPSTPGLTGYIYGNAGTGWTASPTIPTSALNGYLLGAQFPALTGDVTTTAGSLSATIPAGTVTASKMATGAAAGNLGAAGGDLSGSYPSPTIAAGAVTSTKMATGAAYGNLAANSVDPTKMSQAPAGTLRGNLGASTANVSDSALTAYIDAAFGNTRGSILVRGQTGWMVRTPTAAGQIATFDGTDTSFAAPGATVTLFPGLLFGLTLAKNSTNPTTQLDVAAGTAASDDAASRMTLASTMTKTLGAWAAGGTSSSPAGGLDTGTAAANTWYYPYVIYNPTSLVTDVILSASPTSPTLPSGYTKKRRIGSILTTGTATNITGFFQIGDAFYWDATVQDVNVSTLGTTATLYPLTVPPGLKVTALMRSLYGSNTVLLTSPDMADETPSGTNFTFVNATLARMSLQTNASAQVRARSNTASSTLQIRTEGWIDTRGK